MAGSLEGITVSISVEIIGSYDEEIPIRNVEAVVSDGVELSLPIAYRVLSDTDGNGTVEPVPGPNGLLNGTITINISGNDVFAQFSGQANPAGIRITIAGLAPSDAVAPGTIDDAGGFSGVNMLNAPTYDAATKALTFDWVLLGFQPGTTVNQTVFYDNMLEDSPVAQNDSFGVLSNGVLSGINVLDNDSDLDNSGALGIVDPLGVTHVNGSTGVVGSFVDLAGGGRVKVNANGSVTFDPDGDFDHLAKDETTTVTFTYRVTDSTGLHDDATATITVTGVNTPPQITATDILVDVDENQTTGTLARFTISDADGDNQTVTLTATKGTLSIPTTGLSFSTGDGTADTVLTFTGSVAAINTALASLTYVPNANETGTASIHILVNDGHGGVTSTTMPVTIADVDPVIQPQMVSLAENSANGTSVLTLTPTGDTNGLTYSIVGGNVGDAFAIDAVTGEITVANGSLLDFEGATPSYDLIIAVDDEDADTDADSTATITINLTNVNEGPTGIDLSNASVVQSGGANALVGRLSAVDPDAGDTFTYTLVSGSGGLHNDLFAIDGDQLEIVNAGDVEAGIYTVRVRATDSGNNYYEKQISITVVDDVAPAMPSLNLQLGSDTGMSHLDGVTRSTTPTFSGTAEANSTVSLYLDSVLTGTTLADSSGVWIFTPSFPLSDGAYLVTATATDGAGNSSPTSVPLNLTIDTAAPSVVSVVRVGSSGSGVSTLQFAVTFDEKVEGLGIGDFSLTVAGSAQGTIDNVSTTDGITYTVTVRDVSGLGTIRLDVAGSGIVDIAGNTIAGGFSAGETVAIIPPPVNIPPSVTGSLSATVDEGGAVVLGGSSLGFADPDNVAADVIFSVSGTTNGAVLVDGVPAASFTGAQLTAGLVSFLHDDSETAAASFQFSVEDNDEDNSAPATYTFNLNVDPVNDAPHSLALSNASIAENLPAGTVVGTLSAIDPDGDALSYKLTSNPGGFFEIVGNELRLTKPLDFETATSHAITVTATDAAGAVIALDVTVQVDDVVDIIIEGPADDTITGGKGADEIDGGDGNDFIHARNGNDTVVGGDGNDVLIGGNGDDVLEGGAGDDRLEGRKGKDALTGGDGNDILEGGAGADRLDGGDGNDTAAYVNASRGVVASLWRPVDNKGTAKGDSYHSIENLTGSTYADTLVGDDGANVLKGGKGADILVGRNGDDVLIGGAGKETLTGGKGADSFVFRSVNDSPAKKKGWDVITDFRPGQGDRIDLSAIDAKAGTKKDDAFSFIGRDAFSGQKGELRFDGNKKKTFVYGDVDGDKVADFRIELTGKIDLTKDDFVL